MSSSDEAGLQPHEFDWANGGGECAICGRGVHALIHQALFRDEENDDDQS